MRLFLSPGGRKPAPKKEKKNTLRMDDGGGRNVSLICALFFSFFFSPFFSSLFFPLFCFLPFFLMLFFERERQRDRATERQRDRETERQRDRETERQRDRKTERQRDRESVGVLLGGCGILTKGRNIYDEL